MPLAQAHQNKKTVLQEKHRIGSTMNSSTDDGFRNYEENKAQLDSFNRQDSEVDQANREANIEAVVRS